MSRNQTEMWQNVAKRDKPRARPRARTQSKPSLVRTEREKENPGHTGTTQSKRPPRARTYSKPSRVRTESENENPEHIGTERESENLFGTKRESGHLDWEGETERERSKKI